MTGPETWDQAVERGPASAERQGLPRYVEDPEVLAMIAQTVVEQENESEL
jgi:hypothetical protein